MNKNKRPLKCVLDLAIPGRTGSQAPPASGDIFWMNQAYFWPVPFCQYLKKMEKTARVRVPVTSLTSHPLRHLVQQSGQSLFSRTASASCHSVLCPAFIHHTDQGEGTLLSPIGRTQNSCPPSLEPKGPAQRLGHPKLSAVG